MQILNKKKQYLNLNYSAFYFGIWNGRMNLFDSNDADPTQGKQNKSEFDTYTDTVS